MAIRSPTLPLLAPWGGEAPQRPERTRVTFVIPTHQPRNAPSADADESSFRLPASTFQLPASTFQLAKLVKLFAHGTKVLSLTHRHLQAINAKHIWQVISLNLVF